MAATATQEKAGSTSSPRMALASISTGPVRQPARVVLYAPEGVGKTTFGAGCPSPIFICAEAGTAQLDVARFPQPQSWGDVLDAITVLGKENHEYKSLVIDSLDWLEPLAYKSVCETGNKKSIEDFGFGKGYNMAVDLWRGLLARLERLQVVKGMHVILLAHAHIRPFKNPEGEDYDRWELQLNKKIAGLIKQWPDEVLFARFQTFTHEQNDRHKGISNGARIMKTVWDAAYDAKNRHGLPDEIPLKWDALAEFLNNSNDNSKTKASK